MIDDYFTTFSLVPVFFFASVLGVALCLWAGVDLAHGDSGSNDPGWLRGGMRFGLLAVAIALLEALAFGYDRVWEPWPSHVLTVLGTDVWLFGVVISTALKRRRSRMPMQRRA